MGKFDPGPFCLRRLLFCPGNEKIGVIDQSPLPRKRGSCEKIQQYFLSLDGRGEGEGEEGRGIMFYPNFFTPSERGRGEGADSFWLRPCRVMLFFL